MDRRNAASWSTDWNSARAARRHAYLSPVFFFQKISFAISCTYIPGTIKRSFVSAYLSFFSIYVIAKKRIVKLTIFIDLKCFSAPSAVVCFLIIFDNRWKAITWKMFIFTKVIICLKIFTNISTLCWSWKCRLWLSIGHGLVARLNRTRNDS